MPVYEYRCRRGNVQTRRRHMDNRHIPVYCECCGEKATLIPSLCAKRKDHIEGEEDV
jgi:hypothetical protein